MTKRTAKYVAAFDSSLRWSRQPFGIVRFWLANREGATDPVAHVTERVIQATDGFELHGQIERALKEQP